MTIGLVALTTNSLFSQDTNLFKEINTQVWENFEKAFASNDVELLLSIHSTNIIRIPADKQVVVTGQEYFNSQVKSFQWVTENNYQTEINLRFTERICNNEIASEIGIYKYKVVDNENEIRYYYGKFHVLLEKKNDSWKILMDYDNSENNSITEEHFKHAYSKYKFEPFLRKEPE